MDFQTFQVFAQHAPNTLATLLKKLDIQPSQKMIDQLMRAFSLITEEDNYQFRVTQTLPAFRLMGLARQAGLGDSFAHLPIELFSRYCAELDDRSRRGAESQLEEEEIVLLCRKP